MQHLEKEIETPLSRDIFNISPKNRYWFPDRTSWNVADDGRVQVFLPLEQSGKRQRLYHCLMEYLSASEISGVVERIEDWKGLVAKYLEACYRLLASVHIDVDTLFNVQIITEHRDEPGVLLWFPATVCFDAVERAKRVRTTRGFKYRMETTPAGLSQLRFGAYAIAIASTPEECDCYRSEHIRLRDRWAHRPKPRRLFPSTAALPEHKKG